MDRTINSRLSGKEASGAESVNHYLDQYHYLIEPATLKDRASIHAALESILINEQTAYLDTNGCQRYLIKRSGKSRCGFRRILEDRLECYLGLGHMRKTVLTVSSGTNALRLALMAVAATDSSRKEVLMPATTVGATAEAILMSGFQPVLVDVDPETWNIDLDSAEKALSANTAAIVSVDWMGTIVSCSAMQEFARAHRIPWISDSAQSFGSTLNGKNPAQLADATIFSTGYPKVFHTAGRGGILVLPNESLTRLAVDPTGVLRHEPLPEINAFFGFCLLDELDVMLQHRRNILQVYKSVLENLEGLRFQKIEGELQSNAYQLTVEIDSTAGWAAPQDIVDLLHKQRIQSSATRMRPLQMMPRLQDSLVTRVPLPVSKKIGETTLTLPISNQLSAETCYQICAALLETRASVCSSKIPEPLCTGSNNTSSVGWFLADNGFRYWRIEEEPIPYRTAVGRSMVAHMVMVSPEELMEYSISVEQLLHAIKQKDTLYLGLELLANFVIRFMLPSGDLVIGMSGNRDETVLLGESGSSAEVRFCLDTEAQPFVSKRCSVDGIDGNGRPWLKRQFSYLRSEEMLDYADLFVVPMSFSQEGEVITMTMPYVHGRSLAENVLRGAGSNYLFAVLEKVLEQLSERVWSKGIVNDPGLYLERTHIERMKRRLGIASSRHPALGELLTRDKVAYNGEILENFTTVVEKILDSGVLEKANPPRASLIHGDLNLFNILCCEDPQDERLFSLIDPRGIPLWSENLEAEDVERGDFIYDLAKIKFSLSGFIAVRSNLFKFEETSPGSYLYRPQFEYLSMRTIQSCDDQFVDFCDRSSFLSNILGVYGEIDSNWKLRLDLAEASNFIADSACALGRDCPHEVIPFFLIGLQKLNRFYENYCRKPYQRDQSRDCPAEVEKTTQRHAPEIESSIVQPGSNNDQSFGLVAMRKALLNMEQHRPWDLVEILVKRTSVSLTYRLLEQAVGVYLPSDTKIFISHQPWTEPVDGPCVLIHAFDGIRGQINAIGEAMSRTRSFLRSHHIDEEKLAKFRILTVMSTGGSTRNRLFNRSQDKLLMPGPRSLTPLHLILAQSLQLNFPCPGRWITANDGLFLVTREVTPSGKHVAVLAGRRSEPPCHPKAKYWGVLKEIYARDGLHFIGKFDEKERHFHEIRNDVINSGCYFLPTEHSGILERMAFRFRDKNLSIINDFIVPRLAKKTEWLGLMHDLGDGHHTTELWDFLEQHGNQLNEIEWIDAGDQQLFRSIGDYQSYYEFTRETQSNAYLKGLLHLPLTLKHQREFLAQSNFQIASQQESE